MVKLFPKGELSLIKNVCRWLLVLAAAGLLLVSAGSPAVLAQSDNETIAFKDTHLWLYPEYDDPRLLVMLEGKLDGVEAPLELHFLVPAAAEMYAAGSMDAQGNYSGGPPARKQSDIPGWDEINYTVTTDTFRVEYYDPIIRGAPDKTIDYQFRTLYPIASLGVVIQQPLTASNFSVTPRGDSHTDDRGFISQVYTYANLTADDTLEFSVIYTKSDPATSVAPLSQSAPPPGSSDISGTMVAVVVAALVAAALVGGLIWLTRTRQSGRTRGRRPARRRAETSRERATADRFCTQCGLPLESSDRFCPECGNKAS